MICRRQFFMPIKKPPAMQVECTDFSVRKKQVKVTKKLHSDIVKSATNRKNRMEDINNAEQS